MPSCTKSRQVYWTPGTNGGNQNVYYALISAITGAPPGNGWSSISGNPLVPTAATALLSNLCDGQYRVIIVNDCGFDDYDFNVAGDSGTVETINIFSCTLVDLFAPSSSDLIGFGYSITTSFPVTFDTRFEIQITTECIDNTVTIDYASIIVVSGQNTGYLEFPHPCGIIPIKNHNWCILKAFKIISPTVEEEVIINIPSAEQCHGCYTPPI